MLPYLQGYILLVQHHMEVLDLLQVEILPVPASGVDYQHSHEHILIAAVSFAH